MLAPRNLAAKRRDAIAIAISEYIDRHDRVEKAERATERPQKISVRNEKSGRQKLPVAVTNAIMRRSGGSNELENILLLYWAHHDIMHQLSLPIEGEFRDLA